MKSTYEIMGGNYQQNGNYSLPDFEVPEHPKVGIWGECRRKYLRKHQKYAKEHGFGKLPAHLLNIHYCTSKTSGLYVSIRTLQFSKHSLVSAYVGRIPS